MIDLNPAWSVAAVLTIIVLVVVVRTQSRHDFDFADMLKGENGKPTVTRLGVIISLIVTSASLIYATLQEMEFTPYLFGLYIVTWSGAKVSEKLVDAWASRGK